jgi:hypothetical protein
VEVILSWLLWLVLLALFWILNSRMLYVTIVVNVAIMLDSAQELRDATSAAELGTIWIVVTCGTPPCQLLNIGGVPILVWGFFHVEVEGPEVVQWLNMDNVGGCSG